MLQDTGIITIRLITIMIIMDRTELQTTIDIFIEKKLIGLFCLPYNMRFSFPFLSFSFPFLSFPFPFPFLE